MRRNLPVTGHEGFLDDGFAIVSWNNAKGVIEEQAEQLTGAVAVIRT